MAGPTVRAFAPVRKSSLTLSDGRRLAWSEWGPAGGTPVIFCTGAGMSGSMGFGGQSLGRLKLRLIAIDRPGLGASDPHPAKTLTSWAKDVGELIAARALTRPLAVGFSQGAPFALSLAAAGHISGAAIVLGQDELAHPAISPLLVSAVAKMVTTRRPIPQPSRSLSPARHPPTGFGA